MMRLLAKLQDPKLAMADLEKIVSLDVTLSYKMLQYANSAAVALPRDVTSIGHAVRMLGMELLKTWSTALLPSSVEDKPQELMNLSLVRARMCQQLAEAKKIPNKESFLSGGLLSVLDALLDCPMEKAVAELPLADEIKDALSKQPARSARHYGARLPTNVPIGTTSNSRACLSRPSGKAIW